MTCHSELERPPWQPWWKTVLMTDDPDERASWWKTAMMKDHLMRDWETTLMKDHHDERLPWWHTTLMKDCPIYRWPWWITTLMREHPDERPPQWETTLMKVHPEERPPLCELVWPSCKVLGWKAEGPRLESALVLLSLQKLWSVDTILWLCPSQLMKHQNGFHCCPS